MTPVMTKPASRFASLVVILALGAAAAGQARSSNPAANPMTAAERQLIAIKVTGSKRFPEAAIVAATGLQTGTPVTDDDFKRAARQLGDTGAFTDVGYNFSYSIEGTKIQFQVTDAAKFVPARFEDFVWFSDAEMQQRIKQYVPLFDGQLPTSGRMAEEVSDVLQAMLVEAAVPGHVDYVRNGKPDGPVDSIEYKVSDVLIRVRNVGFTGVDSAERAGLESAAQEFSGREYSRGGLDAFVQRQLLPVLYARGYLKAACGEPQPKVVKQTAPDSAPIEGPRNQTVVDVTFAVTPGEQYKLKSLSWSGNHEFPAETLAQMVYVQLGRPADRMRLLDDLKAVQQLYGSRGFITATIQVKADFDDTAGTVAIALEVKEGPVYHMGDLQFRGLDNSLTAKLRNIWKIHPGDVYDASYLDQYLPEAHKLLPTRLDWEVASHVTVNVADKTVDVDLIYTVRAPN